MHTLYIYYFFVCPDLCYIIQIFKVYNYLKNGFRHFLYRQELMRIDFTLDLIIKATFWLK